MASCATYKYPYTKTFTAIDYSEYSGKGFFITESSSVGFDYTPIGSVFVEISPGYEVLDVKKDSYGNDKYVYGDELKIATINDALDELYEKCIRMGANGVIGLKISSHQEPVQSISSVTSTSHVYGNVVTLSAMAIKR